MDLLPITMRGKPALGSLINWYHTYARNDVAAKKLGIERQQERRRGNFVCGRPASHDQ